MIPYTVDVKVGDTVKLNFEGHITHGVLQFNTEVLSIRPPSESGAWYTIIYLNPNNEQEECAVYYIDKIIGKNRNGANT